MFLYFGNPALTPKQVDRLVEHLRESARVDHDRRLSLESLSPEHYQAVERGVTNILSTQNALLTFAQIIDGLPIADVAFDARNPDLGGNHPVDDHEVLCPGCLDKASELQKIWNISALRFNMDLVQTFRKSRVGSSVFNVRLLEIIAVAVHQLGAMTFKADYRLHQGDVDSITNYVDPLWPDYPPPPSLFNHYKYRSMEIYPEGVADVVRYWTENRILGGVFVFDRKSEAADPSNPPNAYIFPDRHGITNRICQLHDDQQSQLLDFLLSETPPQSCPLPMLPDDKNCIRVSFQRAIFGHRIYRDVWERRPFTFDQLMMIEGAPRSTLDYPEGAALIKHINTLPFSCSTFPAPEPVLDGAPTNTNPGLPSPQAEGEPKSCTPEKAESGRDGSAVDEESGSPEEQRKFWNGFFEEIGLSSVWDLRDSDSDFEVETTGHGAEVREDVEIKQAEGGEPGLDEPTGPEKVAKSAVRSEVRGLGSPPEKDPRDVRDDVEDERESKRHRLE